VASSNKRKIINDPVFGFINIPDDFLFEIIQHPYFQRLNRIKQLGLSSFVYPGAQHTRQLHSLGAMHLMGEAIRQLRLQGQDITPEEENAALSAILLHDIGHGPFSHVLEHSLVKGVRHEEISLWLMNRINRETGGSLDLTLKIFTGQYPKKFLHQLVSGQLDMDRLDYLSRDSFFCGVSEGMVGSARIIKMLDVRDDQLVVEAKGIYSIEKFLVARRLMYWQVYLHKTSAGAEKLLVNILQRAKELAASGKELFSPPALHYFLYNEITKDDFLKSPEALDYFAMLDDSDILCAVKAWADNPDLTLSTLCRAFIDRKLYKLDTRSDISAGEKRDSYTRLYMERFGVSRQEAQYFMGEKIVSTDTYNSKDDSINILYKDGRILDISLASDMLNIDVLTKKAEKHFFYYFK
jgi:HD superfamily phosphohydrolase